MICERSSAKRSSDKARPASRLRDELDKRLSAYAGSAIAAGVGLLAISNSAYAKVVYTPAHIKIPNNTVGVPLDLNHDGTADFSFANRYYITGIDFFYGLGISPVASANAVWGQGQGNNNLSNRFASNLPAGRTVGANKSYFKGAGTFPTTWLAMVAGVRTSGGGIDSSTRGQFPYARGRYLGLRFVISGKIHYGWARLNVHIPPERGPISAVVTGYAYETIPGKPIVTGKTKGPDVVTVQPGATPPRSLGRLALGKK